MLVFESAYYICGDYCVNVIIEKTGLFLLFQCGAHFRNNYTKDFFVKMSDPSLMVIYLKYTCIDKQMMTVVTNEIKINQITLR